MTLHQYYVTSIHGRDPLIAQASRLIGAVVTESILQPSKIDSNFKRGHIRVNNYTEQIYASAITVELLTPEEYEELLARKKAGE